MGSARPPLEYLVTSSNTSLESFELSRLNAVANLRKEIRQIVDDWVEAEIEARIARWVLERRRAELASPQPEVPHFRELSPNSETSPRALQPPEAIPSLPQAVASSPCQQQCPCSSPPGRVTRATWLRHTSSPRESVPSPGQKLLFEELSAAPDPSAGTEAVAGTLRDQLAAGALSCLDRIAQLEIRIFRQKEGGMDAKKFSLVERRSESSLTEGKIRAADVRAGPGWSLAQPGAVRGETASSGKNEPRSQQAELRLPAVCRASLRQIYFHQACTATAS